MEGHSHETRREMAGRHACIAEQSSKHQAAHTRHACYHMHHVHPHFVPHLLPFAPTVRLPRSSLGTKQESLPRRPLAPCPLVHPPTRHACMLSCAVRPTDRGPNPHQGRLTKPSGRSFDRRRRRRLALYDGALFVAWRQERAPAHSLERVLYCLLVDASSASWHPSAYAYKNRTYRTPAHDWNLGHAISPIRFDLSCIALTTDGLAYSYSSTCIHPSIQEQHTSAPSARQARPMQLPHTSTPSHGTVSSCSCHPGRPCALKHIMPAGNEVVLRDESVLARTE